MKNIILLTIFNVLFFTGCQYKYSTISINDIKMCTHIADNQCNVDNPNFTPGTETIYISCKLENTPANTEVKFIWYYLGNKRIKIDEATMITDNNSGSFNAQSNLTRPNNGWPTGEYEVEIFISESGNEPVIKKFTVQ